MESKVLNIVIYVKLIAPSTKVFLNKKDGKEMLERIIE